MGGDRGGANLYVHRSANTELGKCVGSNLELGIATAFLNQFDSYLMLIHLEIFQFQYHFCLLVTGTSTELVVHILKRWHSITW